jgi:hypothetical protein
VYQTDYILRLIEQIGTLLRRMLDALRQVKPEEALQLAEEAAGAVADAPLPLIDALGPEGLVQYLSAGGELDIDRAILLGRVLLARAEAIESAGGEGAQARADGQREKASALLAAARAVDADRVERLLAELEARAGSGPRPAR